MKLRMSCALSLVALLATSLSAHIMVSPPQSKGGATQKYELRVHNEGKVATTAIELEIPEGVTVLDIAPPPTGSVTTEKAGARITRITWQVAIAPTKYVALPFTAKNPEVATDLRWTVREHLEGGSIVEWSDRLGAQEKGSATTITAAGPPVQ